MIVEIGFHLYRNNSVSQSQTKAELRYRSLPKTPFRTVRTNVTWLRCESFYDVSCNPWQSFYHTARTGCKLFNRKREIICQQHWKNTKYNTWKLTPASLFGRSKSSGFSFKSSQFHLFFCFQNGASYLFVPVKPQHWRQSYSEPENTACTYSWRLEVKCRSLCWRWCLRRASFSKKCLASAESTKSWWVSWSGSFEWAVRSVEEPRRGRCFDESFDVWEGVALTWRLLVEECAVSTALAAVLPRITYERVIIRWEKTEGTKCKGSLKHLWRRRIISVHKDLRERSRPWRWFAFENYVYFAIIHPGVT